MCIGSSDNGQCYGMASEDDCTLARKARETCPRKACSQLCAGDFLVLGQWPNPIAAQNLPASIQVWYHTDPEAAFLGPMSRAA